MKLLADTHVLIWMFEDNPKLSKRARELILDNSNEMFFSAASSWEIALKHERHPDGNLSLPEFLGYCEQSGLNKLPIEPQHALELADLQDVHKDPFDRMLLCQAKAEKMKLLTADTKLLQYEESCIVNAS